MVVCSFGYWRWLEVAGDVFGWLEVAREVVMGGFGWLCGWLCIVGCSCGWWKVAEGSCGWLCIVDGWR